MNILQINSHDSIGGASKAAYRLYIALKQNGCISRMLVNDKQTLDQDIEAIENNLGLFPLWNRIVNKLAVNLGLQSIYSPTTFRFTKHPWMRSADVINLHNIQGNFFAYPALSALSQRVPVVWTLHDMWGFTGHCGYSFDCERWKRGCGQCPYLDTPPAVAQDTTHFHWLFKNWVYGHSELNIVTPSKWLAGLARSSPLLSRFPVYCIPNSIDTMVYKVIDKKRARQELDIPPNGFYLLFLATNLSGTGIKRKGGDLAIAGLQQLPERVSKSLRILLVGNRGKEWQAQLSFPSYFLGHVKSEERMALCYAAADAFVLPTRQDNLPNTLLESLSCGTPCIAFNVGGVSDAVRHLETGYLARYKDPHDLAQGITLLMENRNLTKRLSTQARMIVEKEFALRVQAQHYKDLYLSLI